MSELRAASLSRDALPVIDIAGLRSDDATRRFAVSREIRAACLDKGFFYIAGHGVGPDLVDAAFAQIGRLFALPLEQKMAVEKKPGNRGYEPLEWQRLEEGTPPDLKESFSVGAELPANDGGPLAERFGFSPNQWPDLPGFRETMQRYFREMSVLAGLMYRGLALSLDVDEHYFDDFYDDPASSLRMIHYPPQPANPLPDQKGCGAHTDFGGITVLAQDAIGGLQVWDGNSGWIHVTPIEGTFVVNLGDFVARWTNDRYRSTLHRVVNLSGKERYSLPFFANGAPEYQVSCVPTCLDNGVAKYKPTSVREHFSEMYRKTAVNG